MRILLVLEDHDSVIEFQRTRAELGHEAFVAACVDEATTLHSIDPFPLVITEVGLPLVSRTPWWYKVRELYSPGYTYIVLLVNKCDRDERLAALQAGADDFIVNPFDTNEVRARIEIAGR